MGQPLGACTEKTGELKEASCLEQEDEEIRV